MEVIDRSLFRFLRINRGNFINPVDSTINVTSVSIISNQTIAFNGSTQLIKTIIPSNATNQYVTWSSSNTSVTTVDINGLVTAISSGISIITVTTEDGGFTCNCSITVSSPIEVVPPMVTGGYTLSDFGENVINNHNSSDSGHSEKNQTIFNYITRDFRNRCTSFQTYNNTFFNYGMVYNSQLLSKASAVDADLIFVPYVNAATWMNGEFYDFVLPVGSHYDNSGSDGNTTNSDRHDITTNAETFITNSIAVASRRDTPTDWNKEVTSFGFGLEFFEDCTPEALDPVYPDKIVPVCFAELRTSADGFTVYGTRSMDQFFGSSLTVGEDVYIVYPGGIQEHRFVDTIVNDGEFTVTEAFTPHVVSNFVSLSKMIGDTLTKICDVGVETNKIVRSYGRGNDSFIDTLVIGESLILIYPDGTLTNIIVSNINTYEKFTVITQPTTFNPGGLYIWRYDTIGTYIGGQAQSWAVPLVAGKLKVIKMTTGSNWDTVRNAARLTAKRNPTGIPEIDNTNWDMYRGFGCIDVQAAINYMNNSN